MNLKNTKPKTVLIVNPGADVEVAKVGENASAAFSTKKEDIDFLRISRYDVLIAQQRAGRHHHRSI